MAHDDPTAKQTPATQSGTQKKTTKGPWGGGNDYTQMKPTLGKGFLKVPPIAGHTQKRNLKEK